MSLLLVVLAAHVGVGAALLALAAMLSAGPGEP
ncbi:hypothetical protein J2T57_001559 [Natronocella acetinitrilica]|uniref:Uncharacterized protein n=1 Tax=Natronocella acetinitrilica TaxID=414046 RepID=A0AAE3G5X0_9GAMM|nr:hypothetical protein [Natronocella acetinitrilica]